MKKRFKMPEVEQGKIITVHWFDAWRNADKYGQADDIKDVRCELEDVGFYVKVKDGYLVIAEERGVPDMDFRHIHHIPLVNIIGVRIHG